MTNFSQYGFDFLDAKGAIIKLLEDGFTELVTPNAQYSKVNVFRRDPIIPIGGGDANKELPCVGVNRIADAENDQFIGEMLDGEDEVFENQDGELESVNNTKGRIFYEIFELRVWAFSAQLRDEIYNKMKRIVLLGKKEYLEDNGAFLVRFVNGVDEADHNFLPNIPMFWGTMQIAVMNTYTIIDKDPYEQVEDFDVDTNIN